MVHYPLKWALGCAQKKRISVIDCVLSEKRVVRLSYPGGRTSSFCLREKVFPFSTGKSQDGLAGYQDG